MIFHDKKLYPGKTSPTCLLELKDTVPQDYLPLASIQPSQLLQDRQSRNDYNSCFLGYRPLTILHFFHPGIRLSRANFFFGATMRTCAIHCKKHSRSFLNDFYS